MYKFLIITVVILFFFRSAIDSNLMAAILTIIFSQVFWFEQQKSRLKTEQKALLNAILAELKAIDNMVRKREEGYHEAKEYIDSLEVPLLIPYLPASNNYFIVYDENVNNLGVINDEKLISDIILTYSEMKGFFDNLKDYQIIWTSADNNIFKLKYEYNLSPEDFATQYVDIVTRTNDYANTLATEFLPELKIRLSNTIKLIEKQYSEIK